MDDWKNLPGHDLPSNVSYHSLQKNRHLLFKNAHCVFFCGSRLQSCTTLMVRNLLIRKLQWSVFARYKKQRVGERWDSYLEGLLQTRARAPVVADSMH